MDASARKTIIMIGVFAFCSASVMLLRLAMRKIRRQKLKLSDYFTIAAIVCVASRTGLATLIVLWGNNNMTAVHRAATEFTATEIYQRMVGSKTTLADRIIYNTYLWIQKSVVLLLYRQMFDELPWPHYIMNVYWVVLAVTYLGAQSVTFAECHPLSLYWQVIPDPGTCTHALIQLIVFIVLNIMTDVMLVILPIPLLTGMKRSLKQRLSLVGLFSIGFLLVAIAIARLPIYGFGKTQIGRNTWGSIEEFAAALVANIPTLFSLRRQRVTTDKTSFQNTYYIHKGGFTQVWEEELQSHIALDLARVPQELEGSRAIQAENTLVQ